ncbi:MAG: hypothetical protein EP338_02040 [Bacteroidetes bacterium]|nr:MAG: hypothetical protein EP338_02040 [Bacteroidota bacterium]
MNISRKDPATHVINAFVVILYLLVQTQLHAQIESTKNYTIEHGLPSNETYQVFQDSRGFIWIGTDRGVSRFNGY